MTFSPDLSICYSHSKYFEVSHGAKKGEVGAYWLESWTRNPKVASSSLGLAGIVGGGSECIALSLSSIPRLRCP